MPGRLRPVLAPLVELVGRGADADLRHQDVRVGPGVRATRVRAHREVGDHPDPHAGRPSRRLGCRALLVGDPLQPGVEPRPGAQPVPLGHDSCRTYAAQRPWPPTPVGSVDLRQRAPGRPVIQRLALVDAEPLERGAAVRGQRLGVDDLQGGALRPPDRVPVDEAATDAGGTQRSCQLLDPAPLRAREQRALADVLHPQVERAGEPPAHRQIGGRAHRRHGLGRVQRVDEHKTGTEIPCAPRRQVCQVTQVAVAPRLAGPQRVQLDGEPPAPAGGQRRGPVMARPRAERLVRQGAAAAAQVRRGPEPGLGRRLAHGGQHGAQGLLADLGPMAVPVPVGRRHPMGLGLTPQPVDRHTAMIPAPGG